MNGCWSRFIRCMGLLPVVRRGSLDAGLPAMVFVVGGKTKIADPEGRLVQGSIDLRYSPCRIHWTVSNKSMHIAVRLTKACGTDAAMKPALNDRSRHARYAQEKTKKLQTVPKNHKAPKLPWNSPQTRADIIATTTGRLDMLPRILIPPISTKVSIVGANITAPRKLERDTSLAGAAIDSRETPASASSPEASTKSKTDGISAMGQASREYRQSDTFGVSNLATSFLLPNAQWPFFSCAEAISRDPWCGEPFKITWSCCPAFLELSEVTAIGL